MMNRIIDCSQPLTCRGITPHYSPGSEPFQIEMTQFGRTRSNAPLNQIAINSEKIFKNLYFMFNCSFEVGHLSYKVYQKLPAGRKKIEVEFIKVNRLKNVFFAKFSNCDGKRVPHLQKKYRLKVQISDQSGLERVSITFSGKLYHASTGSIKSRKIYNQVDYCLFNHEEIPRFFLCEESPPLLADKIRNVNGDKKRLIKEFGAYTNPNQGKKESETKSEASASPLSFYSFSNYDPSSSTTTFQTLSEEPTAPPSSPEPFQPLLPSFSDFCREVDLPEIVGLSARPAAHSTSSEQPKDEPLPTIPQLLNLSYRSNPLFSENLSPLFLRDREENDPIRRPDQNTRLEGLEKVRGFALPWSWLEEEDSMTD